MQTQTMLFERWYPYWRWECFADGMWGVRRKKPSRVQEAAALLADPVRCRAAMRGAVKAYSISARQHLSKPIGRRPWIGQAACCFDIGALEEETRIAWNLHMTPEQQASANAIADDVITEWEQSNA